MESFFHHVILMYQIQQLNSMFSGFKTPAMYGVWWRCHVPRWLEIVALERLEGFLEPAGVDAPDARDRWDVQNNGDETWRKRHGKGSKGMEKENFHDFHVVWLNKTTNAPLSPFDLWLRVEAASSSPWFYRQGHRFRENVGWKAKERLKKHHEHPVQTRWAEQHWTTSNRFRITAGFPTCFSVGVLREKAGTFQTFDPTAGYPRNLGFVLLSLWEYSLETTPAIQFKRGAFIYLQEISDWLTVGLGVQSFIFDWSVGYFSNWLDWLDHLLRQMIARLEKPSIFVGISLRNTIHFSGFFPPQKPSIWEASKNLPSTVEARRPPSNASSRCAQPRPGAAQRCGFVEARGCWLGLCRD